MHYEPDSREGRSVSNEVDWRYGPKVPQPERPPVPRDLWQRYNTAFDNYKAFRQLWFSLGQACAILDAPRPDAATPERSKMLAILRETYTACETRWRAELAVKVELIEEVGKFDTSPSITEQWK